MRESAQNYRPLSILRRQAFRVWGVTLAIAAVWVGAITLAPIAMENGWVGLSAPLYRFYSFICHQLPERSIFLDGHPLAVCSRCFGVYFGVLLGVVVYPLWRRIEEIEPLPRIWLLLSVVPISIDWGLGITGIWDNTHLSRFITGLILGLACATYIIPALVEIRQNRTSGGAARV